MDKLLRDMENLCQTTAAEREERYRKICKMATASEIPCFGLMGRGKVDRGSEIRCPIVILSDSPTGFGKSVEETLEELRDMINFFEDTVNLVNELGHGDLSTKSEVELLIMLDRELYLYNNAID